MLTCDVNELKKIVMFKTIFSQLFTIFLITPSLLTANPATANTAVQMSQQKYQMTITQLAENVYQHVSYKHVNNYGMVPASGLIVLDGKNAHIIDTPWTQADTKRLLAWLMAQGLTAKSSISTHFHDDRASGIFYLNKLSIDTYASKLTNQLLENDKKTAAKHDLLLNDGQVHKQTLVNGTIEVFYPGAGHSPDNIVVWLPEHQLLFGGCFVKSLHSKTLGYTGDADIAQWPASMQNLMNKYSSAKLVVPGHGKIGDISLLAHTLALSIKANKDIALSK
tara:strand:+ start:124 stop:960 length:837 start_codon:yes stop_codon:yes gene_type:complete